MVAAGICSYDYLMNASAKDAFAMLRILDWKEYCEAYAAQQSAEKAKRARRW